jgi:hypothetical protein
VSPRVRIVSTFIFGMAVSALVVAVLFAVFTAATKSTQIRDTQETNTVKTDANSKTLQRIRNCTTPGRPCYERSQQQLAQAVGDVNRVVIVAAACASRTYEQSVDQIQACVLKRLAEQP